MKVLLVDTVVTSHHLPYLRCLASLQSSDIEIIAVLPEEVALPCRTAVLSRKYDLLKHRDYLSWVTEVVRISSSERADIVHLLYIDALYRHFGVGIGRIHGKLVGTFHHFRYSMLRRLSLRRIASQLDSAVVHTDSMLQYALDLNCSCFHQIDYPVFERLRTGEDVALEKARWGTDGSRPMLLCLGGTRADKGLDILLRALNDVTAPFWLVVAGAEQDVDRETISRLSAAYSDSVRCHLRYLEEGEISSVVDASDIVMLPYRRVFDGASGPLALGVRMGKMIVGPSHGSIGQIIREYHLGYTFEAEDPQSLAATIQGALGALPLRKDTAYEQYRKKLNPEVFSEKHRSLYLETYERK